MKSNLLIGGIIVTMCAMPGAMMAQRSASMDRSVNKTDASFVVQKEHPNEDSKFENVAQMAGTYTWTYDSHLEDLYGPQSTEVTLTIIDESTGECELTGICPFAIKAEALPADGLFSIPCGQYLGSDEIGKVYFYSKLLTDDGYITEGSSTARSVMAFIEGTNMRFMSADVWAVGDPTAEDLGYYVLSTNNYMAFEGELDGLETITDSTAEAQYYTLDGVKVDNPATGIIMIEKRGNSVRKVIIK